MSVTVRAVSVVSVFVLLAACGGTPERVLGRGAHHKIRVIIKKETGVCKSRTIPKHHELLKGDEDQFIWSIKDKDGCLAANDLVIKWTTNPSKCSEVTTKANGNKNEISCEVDAGAAVGTVYAYKLYLRDSNSVDTLIEDPDVEIVMF